ncbi:MAG: hypothetical protein ACTTKF_01745 [Bacteroides sp.]
MTLREYLEECYPKLQGGAELSDYAFREKVITQESFEISDLSPEEKRGVHKPDLQKKPFLQQHGVGEARFSNPQQKRIYIIDFEHYIDSFKGSSQASKGKKCDFILSDLDTQSWIVLNELSTGNNPENKRDTAQLQFDSTIEKLSLDKNTPRPFLSQFTYKVALLSYRFSSREGESAVAKGISGFNKPTQIAGNVTLEGCLPEGFVMVQRIYPAPFELSNTFLQKVCKS